MCKDCAARRKMARDALLKAKFTESAKQASIGAAEMIGLKEKTGLSDIQDEQDNEGFKWPNPISFRRK